jgi:putative ABC transport system ATP-binding protein
VIRLRGVHKAFRDGDRALPILAGVDLDVAPGEFVAILGASGSGKSTLLYVAGALDSDFEGEAIVAGRPLAGLSPIALADLRNRQVGFVFQAFNLLPGLSAEENVMLPGMLRRDRSERPAEVRARAREALARVGVADRGGARPARLSGGERQRVALARALLAGPSVLLADEPTGNLDAVSGDAVIRLFRELADGGMAVLVVTHEDRVSRVASRVLHLEAGKLA